MIVTDVSFIISEFFVIFAPLWAICGFIYFSVLALRKILKI